MTKKLPKKVEKIYKEVINNPSSLLHWSHRIIQHDKDFMAIHEVYLREDGSLHSFAETYLCCGSTVEEVKRAYKRLGDAFKHEVVGPKELKAMFKRQLKENF